MEKTKIRNSEILVSLVAIFSPQCNLVVNWRLKPRNSTYRRIYHRKDLIWKSCLVRFIVEILTEFILPFV